MDLYQLGDVPTYRGPTPPTARIRGLPRNPRDSAATMGKLRAYLGAEDMSVCAQDGGPTADLLLASSPDGVEEKATRSYYLNGKMAIWAGRRVNIPPPEYEYWKLGAHEMLFLAERAKQIRVKFRGVTLRAGAEHRCGIYDIPDSPRRRRNVPHRIQNRRGAAGTSPPLSFLPIGFTDSPEIFGRVMKTAKWPNRQHGQRCPIWNDHSAYRGGDIRR